ncbi:MAG: hypothetical protein R6U65_12060 [Perlabentimonas sp.]
MAFAASDSIFLRTLGDLRLIDLLFVSELTWIWTSALGVSRPCDLFDWVEVTTK